jgi:branched-chain amino acid transport system substrate-binding protein
VIKIASQSPLSGGQSENGLPIRNGTDLAVQQLKGNIEKLGFTVQFVPYDDQATADVGVSNAQNIVNDPAILAVIGHYNSSVAIPSSEVYNKSNLVMISPANTNPAVTDRGLPTVNRVCGRDDAQGSAGAAYAVQQLKAKTVYILNDKTTYGEGVATAFRDAIAGMGVNVLGFDGTNETANFDAVIAPIKDANPDIVYFGGISDQIAVFFKQARAAGITAQFMAPDGADNPDSAKIAGDAVVGLVYTTTAGPASVYPDAKTFVDDYTKTFNLAPAAYGAESYAATQIALAAIEKAINDNGGKMPTRKQVSDNVRATKNFKTIVGNITFDANGDRDVASYYVLKVKSADPLQWSSNELVQTSQAPSPLTKAAMAATMAATAAK